VRPFSTYLFLHYDSLKNPMYIFGMMYFFKIATKYLKEKGYISDGGNGGAEEL
jgi:hypothetical protein